MMSPGLHLDRRGRIFSGCGELSASDSEPDASEPAASEPDEVIFAVWFVAFFGFFGTPNSSVPFVTFGILEVFFGAELGHPAAFSAFSLATSFLISLLSSFKILASPKP